MDLSAYKFLKIHFVLKDVWVKKWHFRLPDFTVRLFMLLRFTLNFHYVLSLYFKQITKGTATPLEGSGGRQHHLQEKEVKQCHPTKGREGSTTTQKEEGKESSAN